MSQSARQHLSLGWSWVLVSMATGTKAMWVTCGDSWQEVSAETQTHPLDLIISSLVLTYSFFAPFLSFFWTICIFLHRPTLIFQHGQHKSSRGWASVPFCHVKTLFFVVTFPQNCTDLCQLVANKVQRKTAEGVEMKLKRRYNIYCLRNDIYC